MLALGVCRDFNITETSNFQSQLQVTNNLNLLVPRAKVLMTDNMADMKS